MNQKKKDIVTLLVIASILISAVTYYIASPESPSYLPEAYVTYSGNIGRRTYVNCTFDLDDDPVFGKIRYRGATNLNRPKKGYRFELSEHKSLLGMREDDDWSLFAMYMDHTRMRVKLSFDLWSKLQDEDSHAVLPESKYVSLFVNRKFQGLYLLAEKHDRKLYGLDKDFNGINSSLIFQPILHTYYDEYEDDKWDQDWPNQKKDDEIKDEILPELFSFICDASDEDFFNNTENIYTIFDNENLIDFFLFNYFNFHRDFWSKNYFIIRDTAPSKFFLIPWDFDGSFGQFGWWKYGTERDDESKLRERSVLYDRLLDNDEFRQNCIERWDELREEIFSKDVIFGMIDDMYEEIKDILEIEMRTWKPITVDEKPENKYPDKFIYSTKEFDLDEYIDYLYEWIEKRLDYCDSYFEEF